MVAAVGVGVRGAAVVVVGAAVMNGVVRVGGVAVVVVMGGAVFTGVRRGRFLVFLFLFGGRGGSDRLGSEEFDALSSSSLAEGIVGGDVNFFPLALLKTRQGCEDFLTGGAEISSTFLFLGGGGLGVDDGAVVRWCDG